MSRAEPPDPARTQPAPPVGSAPLDPQLAVVSNVQRICLSVLALIVVLGVLDVAFLMHDALPWSWIALFALAAVGVGYAVATNTRKALQRSMGVLPCIVVNVACVVLLGIVLCVLHWGTMVGLIHP